MPNRKWPDLLLFGFLSGLRERGFGNRNDDAQGSLEPIKESAIAHAGHDTTNACGGPQ